MECTLKEVSSNAFLKVDIFNQIRLISIFSQLLFSFWWFIWLNSYKNAILTAKHKNLW